MNKLLVSGGRLRSTIFKKLEEWESCDQAVLIEFDLANNRSRKCVEYVSPQEVCPNELPAILFKSACLRGNLLYACTSTEVLVYELPDYRVRHYISLPCFNDLHHVCATSWGTLLVVVTGLDMVVEVSTDGKVIREWGVLGQDPWVRFSHSTDYRKVPTTKPHVSHPNYAFELGQEVWVTRLRQRDAICLTNPGLRIDIGVQRPHDGYPFRDEIYFTLVDGRVAIARQDTLQVDRIIDFNQMIPKSDQTLGWCRGVLPLDERWLWVGFTRVRPTKFIENVSWIKHGLTYLHRPSHIALYDVERGVCEREIEVEPSGIGVVFGLLPVP
jgi:hypothetical protein